MGHVFARCIDCNRLFGAGYERRPPSRDELACECGSERFREVRIERSGHDDVGILPEILGDRLLPR